MFHNPVVNYRRKLRCSHEIVYPLYVPRPSLFTHAPAFRSRQTAIFVLYTYASLLMLLVRPFFTLLIDRKFVSASIYNALHFYPCLLVLHALCGGLICKHDRSIRGHSHDDGLFVFFFADYRFLISNLDHFQWHSSQCHSFHSDRQWRKRMAAVPPQALRQREELDHLLCPRDHSALRSRQSHAISAGLPLDSVPDGLLARIVVYSLVQVHGDHGHTSCRKLTRSGQRRLPCSSLFFLDGHRSN